MAKALIVSNFKNISQVFKVMLITELLNQYRDLVTYVMKLSMQRPSAQTMPSTTRTSIITWLRSSSGTAGTSSPCISETRCTTTRSIFSSTTPLPESRGSCRSLIARTMKTLSSPFSQPVSPTVATASARISPAKNSPRAKKTCSNTVPTAPTLSIPSTSAARSSLITTASPSPCRAYRDSYSS